MISFCASGLASNQISLPLGSRIIGPSWVGPNCGATKMSPWEAGADALLTVTAAGSRSGRERKCCSPRAPAATLGMSPAGSWLPGLETLKLNVPFDAPAIGR